MITTTEEKHAANIDWQQLSSCIEQHGSSSAADDEAPRVKLMFLDEMRRCLDRCFVCACFCVDVAICIRRRRIGCKLSRRRHRARFRSAN